MQKISSDQLIPLDIFAPEIPLEINVVYAYDKAPNIFGQIYRKDARLWLHEDLAKIVLLAAARARKDGYTFLLFDGYRSYEAQEKMAQSKAAQENPSWMEEPNRLLSPPGAGAHPRGMAIDCTLLDSGGQEIDMGTVFDLLSEIPTEAHNPAHRRFTNLHETHAKNRDLLNGYLISAAQDLDISLHLLDTEWWDFRLPADIYNQYQPLKEGELPQDMRMTSGSGKNENSDADKKQKILKALEAFL